MKLVCGRIAVYSIQASNHPLLSHLSIIHGFFLSLFHFLSISTEMRATSSTFNGSQIFVYSNKNHFVYHHHSLDNVYIVYYWLRRTSKLQINVTQVPPHVIRYVNFTTASYVLTYKTLTSNRSSHRTFQSSGRELRQFDPIHFDREK